MSTWQSSGAPPPELQEALRQFILGHEAVMRQMLRETIVSMPELLRLDSIQDRAELEPILARLVREEFASSPLSRRAAAPARELALFDAAAEVPPLAPAAVQLANGAGILERPATLLGEPLAAWAARDPLPLPTTAEREGYHGEWHFDYWLSGLEDFLRVRAALDRHGRPLRAPFALLDFGCATGRVLRHFLSQARDLELWGTDLNERHVTWLLTHFPHSLRAFQCTALPILPLPDASLDLVTAFSVFTHIDEYELTWLLELRRLLRPGGIAYLTIHSDDTWARMRPGLAVYDHLFRLRDSIPDHAIGPELFQGPMPAPKVVFRWVTTQLNNTNVFLSKSHIHEVWGRFLEVLEIVPRGSGYQDVVVLRRRPDTLRGS